MVLPPLVLPPEVDSPTLQDSKPFHPHPSPSLSTQTPISSWVVESTPSKESQDARNMSEKAAKVDNLFMGEYPLVGSFESHSTEKSLIYKWFLGTR